MNAVFIGGSRHASRLPAQVKERLNNVIENGFPVLVGDANGADKAVQKYLQESCYKHVTVFCSGEKCRNNLGQWRTHHVQLSKPSKGFQFYAAKDREMARKADFGLMIWDGKSVGTLLNVVRLVMAGKKAVLINLLEKKVTTFKATRDWDDFFAHCSFQLQRDIRDRATSEEWPSRNAPLPHLFEVPPEPTRQVGPVNGDELANVINAALASTDPKIVVEVLGQVAKTRSMSQVANITGLSREGLYRALSTDGNPEFATVLKVFDALGLRLMVKKIA